MAMIDNNNESNSNTPSDSLQGIGNQGGGLKASAGTTQNSLSPSNNNNPRPSIAIMSIETHVQCRNGRGSGEFAMQIHDRGFMHVPVEAEMAA